MSAFEMPKLTPAQAEVLRRMMGGDELYNVFDGYTQRWKLSLASKTQPYNTCNFLLTNGLIKSGVVSYDSQQREITCFLITDAGRTALAEYEESHG